MGHTCPSICLFSVFFKQLLQNFQQINEQNCPSGQGFEPTTFRIWVSSPCPLDQDSHPSSNMLFEWESILKYLYKSTYIKVPILKYLY